MLHKCVILPVYQEFVPKKVYQILSLYFRYVCSESANECRGDVSNLFIQNASNDGMFGVIWQVARFEHNVG